MPCWVNAGTSADNAQFALESIRRWWTMIGKNAYQDATRLLITADAGGSDAAPGCGCGRLSLPGSPGRPGSRSQWSTSRREPPGTSKWNRVEHRLFSFITMNWRARPLESHEVVIETIAARHTREPEWNFALALSFPA